MVLHRERLIPGPPTFIALLLLIPASLLVFLPINQTVGIIVAAVLYLGSCAAFVVLAPTVLVTEDALIAGPASLPIEFAGAVSVHSGSDATAERGVRLDARAWILIRGWVGPVVKIDVTDERDPAPYWLISTRKPADFASAIAQAQAPRQQKA